MDGLMESITFSELVKEAEELHVKKSHDYASPDNPCGNYHFAGDMSQLFHNYKDAGFMGRMAEKLYRLANLENNNKHPKNETIEDTEIDLIVIMILWMSDRRSRRLLHED